MIIEDISDDDLVIQICTMMLNQFTWLQQHITCRKDYKYFKELLDSKPKEKE